MSPHCRGRPSYRAGFKRTGAKGQEAVEQKRRLLFKKKNSPPAKKGEKPLVFTSCVIRGIDKKIPSLG